MKSYLIVIPHKSNRFYFPIEHNKILIGRSSSSDLKIRDRFISKKHILITKKEDHCTLTELSVKNQTRFNGDRLAGQPILCVGDKIKIGKTLIEFTGKVDSNMTRYRLANGRKDKKPSPPSAEKSTIFPPTKEQIKHEAPLKKEVKPGDQPTRTKRFKRLGLIAGLLLILTGLAYANGIFPFVNSNNTPVPDLFEEDVQTPPAEKVTESSDTTSGLMTNWMENSRKEPGNRVNPFVKIPNLITTSNLTGNQPNKFKGDFNWTLEENSKAAPPKKPASELPED